MAHDDAWTVRAGDTLSSIAETRHTSGGWQVLFDLNRSVIGDDPDVTIPGQALRRPN